MCVLSLLLPLLLFLGFLVLCVHPFPPVFLKLYVHVYCVCLRLHVCVCSPVPSLRLLLLSRSICVFAPQPAVEAGLLRAFAPVLPDILRGLVATAGASCAPPDAAAAVDSLQRIVRLWGQRSLYAGPTLAGLEEAVGTCVPERMAVCLCACVCARACVCLCVRARARVCVLVHMPAC